MTEMADDDYGFETAAVGARARHAATGDVATPVHLSTTFALEEAGYPEAGHSYGRLGNPTRDALEERLATLAAGTDALVTASGMAAIATTCLSLVDPGDHVVAGDSLFGGTKTLFDDLLVRFGADVDYVDATDPDAVADAVGPSTELLWAESPTNPLLQVPDLEALADVADDAGATFAVDNTFATQYAQRPMEHGADVSVASTTKFLNGHTDSVGGVVATADPDLADGFEFVAEALLGAVLPPFDCYLVLRGLKTLPARMAAHERSATAVAKFLADHDDVETVNYPGLDAHPQRDVAARQLDCDGGIVSFEVAGDRAETRALVERMDVFTLAMSLGGVESLVEHTASMSAAGLSPAERADAGVSESLVRLSVGLESTDDLLAALDRALGAL
jgi:cystathionine gamma-lyase